MSGPRTADRVYRQSGELLGTGAVQKMDLSDLDPRVALDGLQAVADACRDFPGLHMNSKSDSGSPGKADGIFYRRVYAG